MAPKIDPGGLFLASGAALAKQKAARRLKRPKKRSRDQPKTGPRAPRSDFSEKQEDSTGAWGGARRNARGP